MSIRLHLTLWYMALLAIVLVGFSAIFYGVLKFSLYSEVDRNLQTNASQLAFKLQDMYLSQAINNIGDSMLPLDAFATGTTFVQFSDEDGSFLMGSVNLGKHTLPADTQVVNIVNNKRPHLNTIRIGYTYLRMYTMPVVWNDEVVGMVQVARSLNEIDTTLQQVLTYLSIGTVLALAVATAIGYMLANISLRPIDRIISTANQIAGAQDLDQRLPVQGTDDEVDRLAQTFNDMLARLDNVFQSQIRLSADISHELRTPLTVIRGNLDLLRDGDESPQERAEAIQVITSALDRMSRLVSDLLLLSQADAGLALRTTTIDLDEVVLDTFGQAHALAKGVELKLGRADHAMVQGDSDRLKQLLLNLIDNGLKYTAKGGCVKLSVENEADWVRLTVNDTGQGISREHLPYIFDRFYRVRGQQRQGFGLGLPIAKWIAEAHDGDLSVESELGVGTTFTLMLPRLPDETDETDDDDFDT